MSDGEAGGDGEESGERRGRGLRSSIETHSSAGREHYLYEHGGDDDGYPVMTMLVMVKMMLLEVVT